MKNNMMKKAVAILLAATLTVPNYAVLAEDNTQIEAEAEAARAAEAAAKAEAERQAAEAAARAEAERQAAEAAARAEAERQAAEAAARAEAERLAAEEAARAEAERLAAEEAARAEAERLAAEEEAKAESERQAAENAQSEATTEAPTEAVTEASTEAATEAEKEEKETEKEYKTSFTFENEEVVIKVKVAKEAKLSKNTSMTAKKLEAGSEKYEAAKAATINSLGSDEEGTYSFYEIRFEKDGAELDVKDEHMDIDVTFKDASSAVQIKDGAAKRI